MAYNMHVVSSLLIQFMLTAAAANKGTPDANDILPYTCTPRLSPGECRWSKRTQCYSPIGDDIRQKFRSLTDDLKNNKCQPPDQVFMPIVEDLLVEYLNKLFVGALRENLAQASRSQTTCGACAVRVKCCNKAADFLSQALDAQFCTDGDYLKACTLPRVKPFQLFQHHSKHRDWKHLSANPCDYHQFVAPISHITKNLHSNYGSLLNRTFCSIFGTLGHTMNCIKSDDKCLCCCNQYKPTQRGICVQDPQWRADASCERVENEEESCRRNVRLPAPRSRRREV